MRRKMLVAGMLALSLSLCSGGQVNAQENADASVYVGVEASEQAVCWDGISTEVPTETTIIDGETYYKIYNGAQLAYVAQGASEWRTYNYVLAADIVLNATEFTCDENGNLTMDATTLNQWKPIVNYTGIFDGAGYEISGLYINNTNNSPVGLFQKSTNKIKNLNVKNAYIYSESGYVGGIVGEGTNVTDCTFDGVIKADSYVAGVVALTTGNVSNCTNYGEIYGKNGVAGVIGDVRNSSLEIINCTNYGNIFASSSPAGGVIGVVSSESTISDCVNYGNVSGNESWVGGIVGTTISYRNAGIIYNCINNGNVISIGSDVGGIAGRSDSSIVNCTNNGSVTAEGIYIGGIIGTCANFENENTISGCTNNGKVEVTGEKSYIGGIVGNCSVLVEKCVNNATVNSESSYVGGIVGMAGTGAGVRNCNNNGDVNGAMATAGIVGWDCSNQSVRDCVNRGNICAKEDSSYAGGIGGYICGFNNCVNYGNVTGERYVGGIAGQNGCTSIMMDDYSYNIGNVTGNSYVGGICGDTDEDLSYCYNVGNVTGASCVGAIAGKPNDYSSITCTYTTVTGCYYLKNSEVNAGITAFGDGTADEEGVAESKPASFFPILKNPNTNPAYSNLGNTEVQLFVKRMYTVVLGREADSDGMFNWVSALNSGKLDGAAIAEAFVLGTEFELRGLTNSEFVDVLYRTFMDREVDAEGLVVWTAALNDGMARSAVLAQFVNSDEFTAVCARYGISRGVMLENGTVLNPGISQFVSRMYVNALGREAEGTGLYNHSVALYVGTVTAKDVAKNFFGSKEYELKNTDDATYISNLYAVFMNREADESGLKFWTDTMAVGMSREEVLEEFAGSAEFAAIAASYGLQ